MKLSKTLLSLSFLILAQYLTLPAYGQTTADDQTAAWTTVEQVWRNTGNRDMAYFNRLFSADYMGWSNSSPAPQARASVRVWLDFTKEHERLAEYELFPLSIVIHGDTAIVHYLYKRVVQEQKSKVFRTHEGRYTDVLVRDDNTWKYLSRHGGDHPE